MKRSREEPKAKFSSKRSLPAHRFIPLRPSRAAPATSSLAAKNCCNHSTRFSCPLCLGAISNVVESPCCATLFCRACVEASFRNQKSCPHCRAEPPPWASPRSLHGWTHSKWIQREIDAVAPKCNLCNNNLFEDDRTGHEPYCEGRHARCFKCSGNGVLRGFRCSDGESSEEEETVICDACGGTQCLDGFNWTKCSKCSGRGELFNEDEDDMLCDACIGKGALKGLEYTACFKCRGRGTFIASNERHVSCNACEGKALLKGLDWTKCFNCSGRGTYDGGNGRHFTCHACCGKGVFHGLEWTKCFKCQGKGTRMTQDRYSGHSTGREYLMPCSSCAAKGILKGLDWIECPVCNGHGSCESPHEREDCLVCAGRGVCAGSVLK